MTPEPGVKVIQSNNGVIINLPNDKGQASRLWKKSIWWGKKPDWPLFLHSCRGKVCEGYLWQAASQEIKRSEGRELGQKTEQEGVEGRRKGTIRPAEIKRIVADLNIRPDEIEDKELAEGVRIILQLLEQMSTGYEKMRVENQALRDAMNVLKGEQGQPKLKAKKKNKDDGDVSSEKERKSREQGSEKKSKAKKHKIKIDRTEICPVDKSSLPDDVEFKGYQNVIVQEIIIKTDNVEYQKEVYYSHSQNQTYMGQ